MKPVSKTLRAGPLIKFHSFDGVSCIVGCNARLDLFFQTPTWQTLSQSQGNILSGVVSGKVCCLQAATFQLKVVICEMHSQTKIRLSCSAWPHIFFFTLCLQLWGGNLAELGAGGDHVFSVQCAEEVFKSVFSDCVNRHHVLGSVVCYGSSTCVFDCSYHMELRRRKML